MAILLEVPSSSSRRSDAVLLASLVLAALGFTVLGALGNSWMFAVVVSVLLLALAQILVEQIRALGSDPDLDPPPPDFDLHT